MLLYVCSVIDHRRHQNVVRTKKWHTRRKPSVSLTFLPHFDIFCDLKLNRRMETWNLFVLYNNEPNYNSKAFLFQNISIYCKSWPWPTLVKTKKAIWHNLLSTQIEGTSLVTMHSKELCLVQENHALSNLTRVLLLMESKLTVKAELACKIFKS